MQVLDSAKKSSQILKQSGVPAQIVKSFDDLISSAEIMYRTRTDGLFEGSATKKAKPYVPIPYENRNVSFLQSFVIANTSRQILQSNKLRTLLLIQNLSAGSNLYFSLGQTASAQTGVRLTPAQGVLFDYTCPSDAVSVFFDTATAQQGVILEMRQYME